MLKIEVSDSGAGTSSPPVSNMANSAGSNFQEISEGFSEGSGAALNTMNDMITSWTDIKLDQAIMKMKEMDMENIFLKESLAENNKQIKRQFETLVTYRKRDKEKFDQNRALITSLSEEVKEFQIKLMSQEDKEKEYKNKLVTLENETAHLQRQKALSDQRAYNIRKQAEDEGVLISGSESLPYFSEAVVVTTEDKEKEIVDLESSIAAKEEMITTLRNELLTVNDQREQYKNSNEMLLKDMEGLQRQKEQLDAERRQLNEQNVQLNRDLDKQMQSTHASARKEFEVQQHVTSVDRQTLMRRISPNDSFNFLDDAENLEDMFDRKVTLQESQIEIQKLNADLQMERAEKDELEDKIKTILSEFDELKSQHALAQEKIVLLEKEKIKLSEEFENNLTSISYQKQENKAQGAQISEDHTVLRAQIVSLLHENDELNNRLSAAALANQQKDRRISELSVVNVNWKDQYNEQWHQSHSMIQKLQSQMSQQEAITQQHIKEHDATKQQYQELQDNFSRLVTDYKELLEMIESERSNRQQKNVSREMAEERDKLTAQVMAAEEAINFRDTQLDDYKKKCREMDENVKLLHIQVDTYQTDFQSERAARTQIAQEKNELEDKLKTAEERLNAMTEELNQRQIQDMQRRVIQRPTEANNAQRDFHRPHSYNEEGQRNSYDGMRTLQYQSRVQPWNDSYSPGSMHHQTAAQRVHQGAYGGNRFTEMHRPGEMPQMNTSLYADQDPDPYPSMHQCPKCSQVLPDQDSLQLHLNDCLDKICPNQR